MVAALVAGGWWRTYYIQTWESHLFSIFATMPILHLAKQGFPFLRNYEPTLPFLHFAEAGLSIFATIPFLHLAKANSPSSQLCLFFISRNYVRAKQLGFHIMMSKKSPKTSKRRILSPKQPHNNHGHRCSHGAGQAQRQGQK